MTELKPCPFCGVKSVVLEEATEFRSDHGVMDSSKGWRVMCPLCMARSWIQSDKDKAVRFWNTRSYSDDTAKQAVENWNRRVKE